MPFNEQNVAYTINSSFMPCGPDHGPLLVKDGGRLLMEAEGVQVVTSWRHEHLHIIVQVGNHYTCALVRESQWETMTPQERIEIVRIVRDMLNRSLAGLDPTAL